MESCSGTTIVSHTLFGVQALPETSVPAFPRCGLEEHPNRAELGQKGLGLRVRSQHPDRPGNLREEDHAGTEKIAEQAEQSTALGLKMRTRLLNTRKYPSWATTVLESVKACLKSRCKLSTE